MTKQTRMKTKNELTIKKLMIPLVVMLAFWGVAIWCFTASGYTLPLVMFGYISTSLGIGLDIGAGYATCTSESA